MKSNQVYIHYGSNHFIKERFVPPRNCWWKPKPETSTGLWASREDDPFGWKCWCERNNFSLACLDQAFRFTLSESANLITLQFADQLSDLPRLSPADILRGQSDSGHDIPLEIAELIPRTWCFLDYEKMASDGIDAIEIINWPELQETLATWDCNSIYIMNPDIICEMTEGTMQESHV